MGTTIDIGRVRHSGSKDIERHVRQYLKGERKIPNETAAAIASEFKSPGRSDLPFLLLAQGSPVDSTDLRHAVRREIDSGEYDGVATDMLYALLQWVLDYR